MKLDETYPARFGEARQHGIDRLRNIAAEGTLKPVFYKGKIVGHLKEYYPVLQLGPLKHLKPEVYGEKPDPPEWDGDLTMGWDAQLRKVVEQSVAWEAETNASGLPPAQPTPHIS